MTVFGTRPEAIKMAPVCAALSNSTYRHYVCNTGQHQEILDDVLSVFDLRPDFNFNVGKRFENLECKIASIIETLKKTINDTKPDLLLVHGDTASTMAAAMVGFLSGVPVGHVEAGLRTYNLKEPFPEEFNRQTVTKCATLHFAPTNEARCNLLSEGINENLISVTGNTVIDALIATRERVTKAGDSILQNKSELQKLTRLADTKKLILATIHRRENFGANLLEFVRGIKHLLSEDSSCQLVIPVHPNKAVKDVIIQEFTGVERVSLLEPLSYPDFVYLMNLSHLILTDSGGVQEEAPSLNKPVLILRDRTERPEVVKSGAAVLVGCDAAKISETTLSLLRSNDSYESLASAENPFGDGKASQRIIEKIRGFFNE